MHDHSWLPLCGGLFGCGDDDGRRRLPAEDRDVRAADYASHRPVSGYVWRGAKIFTGDSHALQGDGEVNLTALETTMREVRVQISLHEKPGWEWPFAETSTHWIAMGTNRDLNLAFKLALRNAIEFLSLRAGLSRVDAYGLCSLVASFRVTQVVDVNQGVHAMIPKNIFPSPLREIIKVV